MKAFALEPSGYGQTAPLDGNRVVVLGAGGERVLGLEIQGGALVVRSEDFRNAQLVIKPQVSNVIRIETTHY